MKPAAVAAPKAVVPSSPGRAEKLPGPGLARLLLSKSGSRSRARSSPMFVSRTKSVGRSSDLAAALPEGADPSSPKVTCIGQVRIRKKNKRKGDLGSTRLIRSDGCRCFESALLCKFFSRGMKKKQKSGRSCRSFFCWRKKKTTTKEKSSASASAVEEEEEETKGFVVSSSSTAAADEAAAGPATEHSSPPKNALLLMRCRSAPHNRSSALAMCRLPASPVPASESEEEVRDHDGDRKGWRTIDERGSESCNGSSRDDEDLESRCSSTPQRPVGLMRCMSEPAKKADKLPEVCYGELNGSEPGMVQEVGPTPSPPILRH